MKKFAVGQIWEMAVAERSHVFSPYCVEIIEVGLGYIVTSIPGLHDLKIEKGKNWDYHIPRMKFLGSDYNARQRLKIQLLI